jgi:hypothetical protein
MLQSVPQCQLLAVQNWNVVLVVPIYVAYVSSLHAINIRFCYCLMCQNCRTSLGMLVTRRDSSPKILGGLVPT